jgi:hypothetical protein
MKRNVPLAVGLLPFMVGSLAIGTLAILSVAILSVAILSVATCSRAHAADVTRLASSFEDKDPFDAHISVGYRRTLRRGAVKRERSGSPDSGASLSIVKEARYTQIQHILDLRAEVGIWRDLQLHIALPITLSDSRTLGFALNGGKSCLGPGPGQNNEDNCVTPRNSTLTADGFLNRDALLSNGVGWGKDSSLPWGSDRPPIGGLLLPNRAGVDQLHIGLTWAPFTQRADSTKPTVVVGFEWRIPVGAVMRYSPVTPNANTAVGRGVHELRWALTISRRFNSVIDPWFSMWYQLPLETSSSLFGKTDFDGSGQERAGPQQQGGFEVGLEIVPWEKPAKHHKVTIELKSWMTAFFEGRGYSPMWELFANNSRLLGPCLRSAANPSGPLLWDNGNYCRDENQTLPFPGITNIENYFNVGASVALSVHVTEYLYGRIGVSLSHDLAHLITFADAGRSNDPSGQVNLSDPAQVNPLYRPIIDSPGRRFRVEEATVFDFFVSLAGEF